MTKKSNDKNIKSKIIKAAMDIAAKDGWRAVTIAAAAKKAGVSMAVLSRYFKDKHDILTAFGRMIDARMVAGAGGADMNAPMRDRLFDVLMERFDALNEYRGGVIAVLSDFKSDPLQASKSLPHLCESMNAVMNASGEDSSGMWAKAQAAGITAVYLSALWVWMNDESPDMAKTMAALDKALSFAERVAVFLNQRLF
jgi:ubiquinone biosynthesis protein COQ9